MINQSTIKFLNSGLLITSVILAPSVSLAQDSLYPKTSHTNHVEVDQSVNATRSRPLPETGTPEGNRSGGGTRPGDMANRCRQTTHPLTALVPENASGATTMASPVMWFYMPYSNQDVATVEFSLHDRDGTKTLYRTSVQLADRPGVMGITIPTVLEMEEKYQWMLVVDCEADASGNRDVALDGWIVRTTPDPTFEWDGVWYDALNDVATRYRAEPQNPTVRAAWVRLLDQVGLADLASDPFVNVSLLPN